MSGSTYHIQSTPPDAPTFSWMTQPFMPSVSPDGEGGFSVTFNQGYIFDYANGGNRVAVSNLTHTIGADSTQTKFSLKITFGHQNGGIISASIEKDTSDASSFENFTAQSQIADDSVSETAPAIYVLDLAEFDKGNISDIFIRENIHLHIRGHRQLLDGSPNSAHGVLNPLSSSLANGSIEYRALIEDPESDNIIRITTNGNNIQFYAPPQSGSA